MALNFTIRNLSQTEDEKTFHVEQTEIKRVVNVGATYPPAVSEEGVISLTNDQELPNPASVNIKGPAGPAPTVTVSKVGKVVTVTIGTETFTLTDGADGQGSGDMSKSTYDTNDNGIVDNAEKLEGHAASYFAQATHSHAIADVNGLQDALDGKINTTYTLGITGNAIVLTPSSGDAQQITIPIATASALGLVKIGTGLAIAADGTISNAYSMAYSNGTLAITGPS